jgi:hypothetical protein
MHQSDIVALHAYIMRRLQVESSFQTTSRSAREAQSGEHRDRPLSTIEIPVARRHDSGCHGHLRHLFPVSASRFRRHDLHQFRGRGARFGRWYDFADTDHLFVHSPQFSTTHESNNSCYSGDRAGPGIRVDDVTSNSPQARHPQ